MNDLNYEIRQLTKRGKMHPYSRHMTAAGPMRHELASGGGRLWLGMRRYGYVELKIFTDPRPRRKRFDTARWRALARYRRDRYARDILSAVLDAWRC